MEKQMRIGYRSAHPPIPVLSRSQPAAAQIRPSSPSLFYRGANQQHVPRP